VTHYPVTVRVTAARLAGYPSLRSTLDEMLAPFYENTKDRRFTEFVDDEDEYRKEYENEPIEKVRTPEGDLLWPWNERFRIRGTIGIGSSTHRTPDDCHEVKIPASVIYGDFDTYVREYHECKGRDPETGRYGHRRNPNAKWDWWEVGGRWTGFYPLKPGVVADLGEPGVMTPPAAAGHGDVVHVRDIDFDAVATTTSARLDRFWTEWQKWLDGKEFPAFEGPRDLAMRMGLVRVEERTVAANVDEVTLPWSRLTHLRDDDGRKDWTDVAKVVSREAFVERYRPCFNPIATYAALDDDGWHAPGQMGWFGMSNDEPEDFVAFKTSFVERVIKAAAPDDLLVVVDCHI
jgi:hypothetical protein